MNKFNVVGKREPMLDALEKATGQARYTDDLSLPGMLFGKILRNPHPHAKILSIDTSKAEKCPGVRCVVTDKDVPQQRFSPTPIKDSGIS